MRNVVAAVVLFLLPVLAHAQPGAGNRLAYLDEVDPYYPHARFPKLITPQWVGEAGVDAVVVLAIDDMRDPKRYEAFLRPILRRLKEIDGRAPVSIMTNLVDPKDPQLQRWLKEGVSLECHTLDHPCPFFKDGFGKARETYDKCVNLMHAIPNNKPVAFRMPCCDSLNTPSPRFYAEVFNKTTDKGKFLQIDSSVFNVFTANDSELPRELVLMPDGTERFRRYLPRDRSFVNSIEDYPYPYVIGRLCWQFPCMTPSDWQAQFLQKPNNPQTVKDWQAALDCTVIKKGVMTMVFHPHGWIRNDQIVELVDYTDKKYGKRVKFLNFGEALERLNKNLLRTDPVRNPEHGRDNGIRLADLNNDGFMAVVVSREEFSKSKVLQKTHVWQPKLQTWYSMDFPELLVTVDKSETLMGSPPLVWLGCFGIFRGDGKASFVTTSSGWHFDGKTWVEDKNLLKGLTNIWIMQHNTIVRKSAFWPEAGLLRDLEGDGKCEFLLGREIYRWSADDRSWKVLPFQAPRATSNMRLMDLDADGKLDIIFSNETEYGVYLFKDMKDGWSRKVIAGKAGDAGALPMIANNSENMGFFVHSGQLWWSNESTALLKDHVARLSIQELLSKLKR
jgi:Polysaccharide deacetylase